MTVREELDSTTLLEEDGRFPTESGVTAEEEEPGMSAEEDTSEMTDEEMSGTSAEELAGSAVAEESGCVSGPLEESSEHAARMPATANAVASFAMKDADVCRAFLMLMETS